MAHTRGFCCMIAKMVPMDLAAMSCNVFCILHGDEVLIRGSNLIKGVKAVHKEKHVYLFILRVVSLVDGNLPSHSDFD